MHTCRGICPSSLVALALAPYCSNSLAHSGWHSSQASCRAVLPPGARSTRAPLRRRCRRHSVKPRPAVMCSGVVSSCSYVSDHSPEQKSTIMRLSEDFDVQYCREFSTVQLVSTLDQEIMNMTGDFEDLKHFCTVCVDANQSASIQ